MKDPAPVRPAFEIRVLGALWLVLIGSSVGLGAWYASVERPSRQPSTVSRDGAAGSKPCVGSACGARAEWLGGAPPASAEALGAEEVDERLDRLEQQLAGGRSFDGS